MCKKLFLSLLCVVLFTYTLQADDLNSFKKHLLAQEYEKAIEVYSKNLNGLDTIHYQQELFKTIINHINTNPNGAEELTNQFLQIEYNHPFGVYLLSQIKYLQSQYEESLGLIYQLQNSYLDNEMSQKVSNTLPKMVRGYLDILHDKKDMEKLDTIVDTFVSNNDMNALSSWQETILLLAKENKDNKYYDTALELLKKLKNYNINDDINLQYQNLYDVLINEYLQELESTQESEKLQKLIDDLLQNNKPQIQKAQNLLMQIERKEKLAHIDGKKIALKREHNQFFIDVFVNGSPRKLLLDTGASTTMLNRSALSQNAYTNIQKDITLYTALGAGKADMIKVDSFMIEDIEIQDFEIIVSKSDVFKGYDGLLGMNFLKHFHFQIDMQNVQLILNATL